MSPGEVPGLSEEQNTEKYRTHPSTEHRAVQTTEKYITLPSTEYRAVQVPAVSPSAAALLQHVCIQPRLLLPQIIAFALNIMESAIRFNMLKLTAYTHHSTKHHMFEESLKRPEKRYSGS